MVESKNRQCRETKLHEPERRDETLKTGREYLLPMQPTRGSRAVVKRRKLPQRVKVWTLAIAPLIGVRLVTSSALQSGKWQLIGMN